MQGFKQAFQQPISTWNNQPGPGNKPINWSELQRTLDQIAPEKLLKMEKQE